VDTYDGMGKAIGAAVQGGKDLFTGHGS
jgi:hypothetical protein